MAVLHRVDLKGIDQTALDSFRQGNPPIAQMKHDSNRGLLNLLDGIEFRKGGFGEQASFVVTASQTVQTLVRSPEESTFAVSRNDEVVVVEPGADLQKRDAVHGVLESILSEAVFSARWKQEGIQEPLDGCKERAISSAMSIYDKFSILPIRVAPSIEEGVMVTYRKGDKELFLEFYNSGEAAGLINVRKSILTSEDIEGSDQIDSLVTQYLKV